jgi:hypothetical protein
MIFEEIQQRLDQDLEEYKDDEEREREEKKHHLYQLKQQLEHTGITFRSKADGLGIGRNVGTYRHAE